jgi:hypothetical protein
VGASAEEIAADLKRAEAVLEHAKKEVKGMQKLNKVSSFPLFCCDEVFIRSNKDNETSDVAACHQVGRVPKGICDSRSQYSAFDDLAT